MLYVFKTTRVGFNEQMNVGDIIDYEKSKYIVIQILNTSVRVFRDPKVISEVVCQKIGESNTAHKYMKNFTFSKKYNIAKQAEFGSLKIYKVGEVLFDGDSVVKINGIEKFSYEFVDLVITYEAEVVQPWSDYEMNQAIKANRISKFKVISS